jgi:hypothetical protein
LGASGAALLALLVLAEGAASAPLGLSGEERRLRSARWQRREVKK